MTAQEIIDITNMNARKLFGNTGSLYAQLKYLIEEGTKENSPFSVKFALFVFCKALYKFYKKNIKDGQRRLVAAIKDIVRFGKSISNEFKNNVNGHPWEIIYKYLAFCCYEIGEKKIAEKYMSKADSCIKTKGPIISLLVSNGWIEYYELLEDNKRRQSSIERAWKQTSNFKALTDIKAETPEDKRTVLKDKLSYMYH